MAWTAKNWCPRQARDKPAQGDSLESTPGWGISQSDVFGKAGMRALQAAWSGAQVKRPKKRLLSVGLPDVAAGRNVAGYPDIAPDYGSLSDGDTAQNGCPRVNDDIILDDRMARHSLDEPALFVLRKALAPSVTP